MNPDGVRHCVEHSVLCWLASVGPDGTPNVSPKEVFRLLGEDTLLIADIASAGSVRNLRANPHACVSLVDVFVQKGCKLRGIARVVGPHDADWAALHAPLAAMAGEAFVIRHVIAVRIEAVEPILAPSYRFRPDTTEAEQVAAAMRTYGVRPADAP